MTVISDMGMPSGKPKTIAVDLTGKFLSDSREVRIVTNMCVYWDEIYLGEDATKPAVRLSSLSPERSDVHFEASRHRISIRRESSRNTSIMQTPRPLPTGIQPPEHTRVMAMSQP